MMPSVLRRNSWRKDKTNVCLLLFLYLLQGIPLGMAAAVPLLIQSYGTTWSEQATFSFAFWPFSLKLLWAPIVDAVYCKKYGRRKTWLIPVQYLIGLAMITVSFHIDNLLLTTKTSSNKQSHVYLLTSIFFGLSFLAATQDICVDGWAISMLSRDNVGWASTCNTVGQTAGFFLGNTVFLALESKDFSNNYIRKLLQMEPQSAGLITLSSFLLFWGIVFIISTTLVAIFKRETEDIYDLNEPTLALVETYKILLRVLRLPSMRSIAFILLTAKVGFAATDAMTGLELIERGVSRHSLALLAIPLVPLQIILPFLISKHTTGSRPLNIFVKSYPYRLVLGVFMGMLVYITPSFQNSDKTFPWSYYTLAVFIYGIHQVFVFSMFVSQMAFYAQISDPKIGATYMTLLNTLTNLGNSWASTGALYAADYLTWNKCSKNGTECRTATDEKQCQMLRGLCQPYIDPYYIELVLCILLGIVWFTWKHKTIIQLQFLPASTWLIRSNGRKSHLLEQDDDSTDEMTA